MKKLFAVILAAVLVASCLPVVMASENEAVIIYTNDVHCAVENYPVLAAYKAELEAEGKNVVLVDAGDSIQGELIGTFTNGEAVADIMNTVGYDYAVPGNHEFDYGMEAFLDIAKNKAQYDYISSNFYYLPMVDPVLAPYIVEDFGDFQVAFVGISTPETISSSNPEYFKDENGNFIYGFPNFPGGMTNEALYTAVQDYVDMAVGEGADVVVAVAHSGILGSKDGWKSSDIIANTYGIDYYIDGHSHETTESAVYKNAENEDVLLTSAGTKLADFGVLTIDENSAEIELISTDDITVESMSDSAQNAYNTVKAKVDGYNEVLKYYFEEIGTSEVKLVAYEADYSWAVRKRETNAGDFVADAYRAVTGADVAIVNGGGVRAEIEPGNVTRKKLIDMNPFAHDMCVLEVTGQQLVDVLEFGARSCPDVLGSFFQVSGITFEIHTYLPSPVSVDSLEMFIGIDETMPRRVKNVKIGGEAINLEKKYTLAGSTYVLIGDGNGLTMLDGATVVELEGLPCDNEMLIEYFIETLGGTIPAAKYADPDGEGRIVIFAEKPADTDDDTAEPCDHICHSANVFLSFIWTIANFIHSLLGIAPVCACGEAHY